MWKVDPVIRKHSAATAEGLLSLVRVVTDSTDSSLEEGAADLHGSVEHLKGVLDSQLPGTRRSTGPIRDSGM